jgi:hypothetical protein
MPIIRIEKGNEPNAFLVTLLPDIGEQENRLFLFLYGIEKSV